MATPAVAKAASLANLAGVASPADFAEVSSSAVAEVASSADLADHVSDDFAEVVSLLRWCPLTLSRLVWCLRPIRIVLLLLVCHK